MRRLLPLLLLVPVALGVRIPASAGASFDCARAAALDERAVCGDPALSDLDSALGQANAEARARTSPEYASALLRTARGIMAQRRACGSVRRCLVRVYVDGLESYQNFGSTVPVPGWAMTAQSERNTPAPPPERSALPTRIGQCVDTTVTSVTARLEGEPPGSFESGTAINFANGGFQVTYETDPALIASRPGDPATMCLVALPHDCPRGDDRGKVYRTTNLRTRATWALPDSQHVCGGA